MANTNKELAIPMKCGGCGCATFTIYNASKDYTNLTKLIFTCENCGSKSIITIIRPTMMIDWEENSNGCITTWV